MTRTVPPVPMPLRIVVSLPTPALARLTVTGDIDLASAPTLGMRLLAAMQEHHPTTVEVNLAKVRFMDCSGIAVLVAVRNAALKTSCRLWITGSQGLVEQILDVTGVLAVFTDPAAPGNPRLARLSRWRPRLGRRTSAPSAPASARAA